jgi:hypothetical protein
MDPHSLASLGNQFWLKTSQNISKLFLFVRPQFEGDRTHCVANACHSLCFHWGNMAVKLGTSVQCLQMVPRVVWPRPPLANCAGCPSRLRSTLCRIEKDHCGSAVSCRGVDPRWFGWVSETILPNCPFWWFDLDGFGGPYLFTNLCNGADSTWVKRAVKGKRAEFLLTVVWGILSCHFSYTGQLCYCYFPLHSGSLVGRPRNLPSQCFTWLECHDFLATGYPCI